MGIMDLTVFLILSWVFPSTVVCQNPKANDPATVQPPGCAKPNCDCCITKDCNTCNGNCIEGIFGDKCHNKCPDRCVSCDDYGLTNWTYRGYGYCTECKPGYYSDPPDYFQCNYRCSDVGCVSCQSATQCHSCNKGYYLEPTTQEYGECIVCPSSCTACISLTFCSECKSAFQGNICEDCRAGFYGDNCNTPCPGGCKDNICIRSSGDCVGCEEGFTSTRCDTCLPGKYGQDCNKNCPKNCRDSRCDRYNGQCTTGCVDNFAGLACDKCIAGKYGADCTEDCPVNCYKGICNRETRYCSGCTANFRGDTCEDCEHGWYGTDCSLRCQLNCKGTVCKRENGKCVECNDGFYGPNCIKSCSLHCSGTTCNQDGFCDQGCQKSYSGDRCCVLGDNCLECSSNTMCAKCIVGTYGESCEKECPVYCEGGTCNKDDGSCPKPSDLVSDPVPAGAIAGGVVGVSVVIGATVVLVVYLMKRRQGLKEQMSPETDTYLNLSGSINQANRGTANGSESQINEMHLENQRLKEEIERLMSDLNESREKCREYENLQSHYMSLDIQ